MSARIRAASFVLAAALSVSGGCAVPLSQNCGGWPGGGGGPRCIDRERASFIVPGETTKDDVIRELGPPTRLIRSGSVYGYDGELGGWVMVFPGLGGSLGFAIPRHHLLLVEFDQESRVVRTVWKEGTEEPGEGFPYGGKAGADGAATGAGEAESRGAPRESQ